MPSLKRIFRQGKSKASNTLVALCIGDYSRLTLNIENGIHALGALLAHDTSAEDGSLSPRQPPPEPGSSKGSFAGVSQQSFRAFRYVLQHFGGASASSPHDGASVQSEQMLTQFLKQLGGCSSVSFVAPTEDGLVLRDKVLSKLTKLFKQSTAPVVIVSYCGPSDERGNWRLSSQVAGGGSNLSSPSGSAASERGGGGGGAVVSFREVSILWQRYRKHSQRLVLLLDCANSGYWVSALRMLSKAEQLELSLGVQASDSSSLSLQHVQLTYQPGIFTQLYLSNNKLRRDPRRTPTQQTQSGGASGQQAQPALPSASPPLESLDPQEPQEPQGLQEPQSPQDPQPHRETPQQQGQQDSPQQNPQHQQAPGPVPRVQEQWLVGMFPSYYATWLNDNLVDYGIALRFFHTQTVPPGSMLRSELDSETVITGRRPVLAIGRSSVDILSARGSQLLSPVSQVQAANRGWQSGTPLLVAMESPGSPRVFRRGDEAMASPGGNLWVSRSVANTRHGCGQQDVEAAEGAAGRQAQSAASRAASLPDSARLRWSSLAEYSSAATGGAMSEISLAGVTVSQMVALGSPTNPLLNRVRMSTPQAEWRQGSILPSGPYAHRFPTLPGEDSIYKIYPDAEGLTSAENSAPVSEYASMVGTVQHGVSGGTRLPTACATDDGADARSNPMPRPPSPPPPPSQPASSSGYKSSPSLCSLALPPPLLQPSDAALAAMPMATAEVPRPPASFAVAAVQQHDAGMDDDRTSFAVAAGAGDDDLAVMTSARSDTAAMKWGRRSVHAEQRLLEEERGHGVASSFTEASPLHLQGFDCELFGALQTVATERRLIARRAPLEGDESLDTMMRDTDSLELQASVASLPSAMLPRDIARLSSGGNGAVGGGVTNSNDTPSQRTPQSNSLSASMYGVSRPSASTAQLLNTRSSATGFVTVGSETVTPSAPAEAGNGTREVAPASTAAPRQLSRLFLVSMGDAMPPCGTGGEELEEEEEEEEEEGANVEAEARGRGRGGASGLADVAVSLLSTQVAEMRGLEAEAEAEAVGAGQGATAFSIEWLQPAHSPAPSPVAGDRRVRASVASGRASSSHMLRNLLRSHVCIADSMELDTASAFAGPSAAARRPGRFEMAGSESSSFVFGDDRERFEMLKLLRQHQAEGEEAETLAVAGPAAKGPDEDYVVVDHEHYGGLRIAGGEGSGVAQAEDSLLVSAEGGIMRAASAGAGGMGPGDGVTFVLSMEDRAYCRDPQRLVSRQRSGRECEAFIREALERVKSVREVWGPESEERR